jgi:hypothetical protein
VQAVAGEGGVAQGGQAVGEEECCGQGGEMNLGVFCCAVVCAGLEFGF